MTEAELPAGIELPVSIAAGGFAADGALAAALLLEAFIPEALGGLEAELAADDGGELAEGTLAVEGGEVAAELPEVPLAEVPPADDPLADVPLGGVSPNFPPLMAVSEPPGAAGLLAELSGPPAGALGAGFEAAAPEDPDDPVDEPELLSVPEEEALSPVLGLELESPDEALGLVDPEESGAAADEDPLEPAEPPGPDISAGPPVGALPLSAPMLGPELPGEAPPAPPSCA